MLFVTRYRTKPFMTPEETRDLLKAHAEVGPGKGELAHYIALDHSHGLVLNEADDAGEGYRHTLNFSRWLEFDTTVMLPVDDVIPHLLDAYG